MKRQIIPILGGLVVLLVGGFYADRVAHNEMTTAIRLVIYATAFTIIIVLSGILVFVILVIRERFLTERENRKLAQREVNVMVVTADEGQQVYIRDLDTKAIWRNAHLDSRVYANGQRAIPNRIELSAWQTFTLRNRPSAIREVTPKQLPAHTQINLLEALDGVQRCLIVGPSNSGKTTILQHVVTRRLHTSKKVFDLYVNEGLSLIAVQKHLDENGYKGRLGKALSPSGIRKMLSNPVYVGSYRYSDIKISVPALIDQNIWSLAQSKREFNKKYKREMKHYHYPFSGRGTCGHCGYKMVGLTNNRNKPYFRCNASRKDLAREFKTGICSNDKYFRLDKIEPLVMDWIKELLTDKETLKRGLEAYKAEMEAQHSPLIEDHKRAKKLLDDKRERLTRLLDLYLEKNLDKDTFLTRKLSLEQDIKLAELTVGELTERLEQINLLPQQIETVEKLGQVTTRTFEDGIPPEQQRRIIEALDVQLKLCIEDGNRVFYATCILTDGVMDHKRLDSIVISSSTSRTNKSSRFSTE